MHLKIYQIDMDRDKHNAKFRGLTTTGPDGMLIADASSYDEVFDGIVDCQNAEDVFCMFNITGHPLNRGHSLSVSDVVVMDGQKMICQPIGFDKVNFDESLAHKPEDLMRVLYVEPGKYPVVAESSYRDKDGKTKYQDLFFPISNAGKADLEKAVLDAYSQKLSQSQDQALDGGWHSQDDGILPFEM